MLPFQIAEAPNVRRVDPTQEVFEIDIVLNGVVAPFVARENDPVVYGRQLHADIVAGKFGPIAAYVQPSTED